jgi:hypothetical protein
MIDLSSSFQVCTIIMAAYLFSQALQIHSISTFCSMVLGVRWKERSHRAACMRCDGYPEQISIGPVPGFSSATADLNRLTCLSMASCLFGLLNCEQSAAGSSMTISARRLLNVMVSLNIIDISCPTYSVTIVKQLVVYL